jgi:putative ABC transport system permease protein
METIWQDIRHGARMLKRNPGFALIAVLTLGLGIGATTAIFSVVDAVLIRPLPYKNPDRLVMVWETNAKESRSEEPMSLDDFKDFQQRSQSFEEMAAVSPRWIFNLTGGSEPEQVGGLFASAGMFNLLGAGAAHGRTFTSEDDTTGSAPVVIISHGLWQRQFGGDTEIIGKSLRLGGNPATIIGIMPEGFRFLEDADLWVPLASNPVASRGRGLRLLSVAGRLREGVTISQAEAELASAARELEEKFPATNTGIGARVVGLHAQMTGGVRTILLVLLGAVVSVLLIACANVANLLLARASVRQKEIAIRAAIGATRRRLARQFLTESVMLALAGGAAGLLLAMWGVDLLIALSPPNIVRQSNIEMNGSVLAFAIAASALTGLIFGLAPAWQASRPDLNETLKEGGRSSGALASHSRFRRAIVTAEIAISLLLLIGSGLLIRSFARLTEVNPGFAPENVLTFTTLLPDARYSQPQQRGLFYNQLEERLKQMPEVVSVGAASRLPLLTPNNNITSSLSIEGRPLPPGNLPEVDFRRASTDYFETMGIPLLEGRAFTDQEVASGTQTAIVNEAFAQRFFPGEEVLGKRVKLGPNPDQLPWITIVGVVGNVRHLAIETEPRPEIYRHYMTFPLSSPAIVVRSSSDPKKLIAGIRAQVQTIDAELSIANIHTMDELMARSVAGRRFSMTLLAIFACVAILLAAVGLYGVMSYSVVQRTHELGVRMALGASRRDVVTLVVGQAARLAVAGIAIGLIAAIALTRLMGNMLYEISATDPATFAAVALLIGTVALLASYVPARRATRVDPMVALRHE